MENTKPYFNVAHICKIYKFNTRFSKYILVYSQLGQNIFYKFYTGNDDINLQKYVFHNVRENLFE